MKRKELLIIFVLAILATGLGCSLIPVQCREVCTGWPLVVYESLIGWDGHKTSLFYWPNLVLDCLFWFLVLVALYHVGHRVNRWRVTKKLKGGKMKAEVFKNEKS